MILTLLAILLVLLAIDWRQTITISRTPGRREVWIEKIIGTYPKEHRVHMWFGACAGAAIAFALLAPEPWPWALALFAVGEAAAVVRDHQREEKLLRLDAGRGAHHRAAGRTAHRLQDVAAHQAARQNRRHP